LTRAEERGAKFGWLYARRQGVLLLIGLIHAFLIWFGDILVVYSLLGFMLLFFRRARPRTLLRWSAGLLLVPVLLIALLTGLIELGRTDPEQAAAMAQSMAESDAEFRALAERAFLTYSSGTWGEIMAQRAQDVLIGYALTPFLAPNVLAMFLLGVYAWRRGVITDVAGHVSLLRAVFRWGIGLGLPAAVLFVLTSSEARTANAPPALVWSIAFFLGGPMLSLGYAAGIVLLLQGRGELIQRLAPIAAAGRMALTNYLLQSVIATTVLYSYGLGLYDRIGPALGIPLVVAIYAFNVGLSVWWLRRFRYGPMEWLWRSLTYRRLQSLR
jgi:uncharacterized protein